MQPTSNSTSSEQLLDKHHAAAYLGIPLKVLMNQVRLGSGPAYTRPSPRTIYFSRHGLDAWRASWARDGGHP